MTERTVKVVVVGDPGCGKTSLITSAVSETFSRRPPPTLPETRIPANKFPENVAMMITDTSSRPEDKILVEEAIGRADAVALCFDPQRRDTLQRVRSYWLPQLQKLNTLAPILLVCCKVDDSGGGQQNEFIREVVEPLVRESPQVEVCINCSAASHWLVKDVFHLAVKAVLYPVTPLYNRSSRQLTVNCCKALKRVFNMCDEDQDAALNNEELNAFQQQCFSVPLSQKELQDVCQVVADKMPGGVDERGLTLAGFLFINCLFIERGRLEATWAILRKFGYNDALTLSDYVAETVNFSLADGWVWELSAQAERFLMQQFERGDADEDGLLTFPDVEAMFDTSPNPIWKEEQWQRVLVHPGMEGTPQLKGAVSWVVFQTRWRAYTQLSAQRAFEQLLYMGYHPPPGHTAAALLTKCPRQTVDKRADFSLRRTIHCFCFGAASSGRTSLIKSLAGLGPQEGPLDAVSTAGSVQLTPSTSLTLLMTEVSAAEAEELCSASAAVSPEVQRKSRNVVELQLAKCDVAAFLFDSSNHASLEAAVELLVKVAHRAGDALPCVLVSTKDDLIMSSDTRASLDRHLRDLCLPRGPTCSALEGRVDAAFRELCSAALLPALHIPDTPAKKVHRTALRRMALASGGLVLTGLTTYLVYKMAKRYHVQAVEGLSASLGGGGGGGGGSDSMNNALSNMHCNHEGVALGLRALLD